MELESIIENVLNALTAGVTIGCIYGLMCIGLGLIFGMGLMAGYYLVKGMAVNLVERLHHGVAVLNNLLVPQDAVAYVPMAAGGDSAASGGSAPQEFAAPKEEAAATAEESFDDVSVEDIKDEEEII